jgi:hypothetical protein
MGRYPHAVGCVSYLARMISSLTCMNVSVNGEEWARLAREWFPELADSRLRQVTWPAIGEHRDDIAGQLAAGVTVATIHQRLTGQRGWR